MRSIDYIVKLGNIWTASDIMLEATTAVQLHSCFMEQADEVRHTKKIHHQ